MKSVHYLIVATACLACLVGFAVFNEYAMEKGIGVTNVTRKTEVSGGHLRITATEEEPKESSNENEQGTNQPPTEPQPVHTAQDISVLKDEIESRKAENSALKEAAMEGEIARLKAENALLKLSKDLEALKSSTTEASVAVTTSGPEKVDLAATEPLSEASAFDSNNRGQVTPKNKLKFFLVAPPETTSDLVADTASATTYYKEHLNEDEGEIWLHRGFARMTAQQASTPQEADVILVAGYMHMNAAFRKGKGVGKEQLQEIYEKHMSKHANFLDKPHLLMFPAENPGVAKDIGCYEIVALLKRKGVKPDNIWSVGFERNQAWQGVPVDRIVSIPYVVHPHHPIKELREKAEHEKISNSVFYAGDARNNAVKWGGCNRTAMLSGLQRYSEETDGKEIFVRVVDKRNRLSQEEYNHRMLVSEYCLLVCGDTPTSRSLASSMVAGCIPIRVGSRLRGRCDPPCKKGWGWSISGEENPHLPYSEKIPWEIFPEVGEQDLIVAGIAALDNAVFKVFKKEQKVRLQSIMHDKLSDFIYGWGDPVTSSEFGGAVESIWHSFGAAMEKAALKAAAS